MFNLLLVYQNKDAKSSGIVPAEEDRGKEKMHGVPKKHKKKSRATFTPWDSSLGRFECRVKPQGIWVSLDVLVV